MGALGAVLRPLAMGAAFGLALALGRAPLGVDLASTPAVGAGDAFAWRGFALAGIALALGSFAGARAHLAAVVVGAAGTFALHAAYLSDTWRLQHPRAGWLVFGFAVLAGWALRPRGHALPGADEDQRLGRVERLGWLLAGLGVAVALEGVARPLRLLGGARAADDLAFAAVFGLLLAVGAVCFGRLLPRPQRPAACAVALTLGAVACVESLAPLELWSSRMGLDRYLRDPRWDLDLSHIGMLTGDTVLALRVWMLPAFALGGGLAFALSGPRASWILFGAGMGTALMPAVLTLTAQVEPERTPELPALRVAFGAALCALGAAAAAASARSPARAARWGAALACLAFGGAALALSRARVLPLSPWENFPIEPVWLRDTAGGLMTVEDTFDGGRVVTLDRRRLTPAAFEVEDDERALRIAWERAAPADASGERRVLLIGQLTPARARVLLELGATAIDRCASWHPYMAELEELLFDGDARPAGEILSARALGRSGPWALVVAPAVQGDAPVVRAGEAEEGPRVVWCSTQSDLARRDWGEHVALAAAGLERLWIAPWQPDGVRTGPRTHAPAPWRVLAQRDVERGQAQVTRALERLASGARGTPDEALAEGLALHAAAQRRSSPFESDAQSIEVDARALELLQAAALAREPDRFLRDYWSELARVLGEKREIVLTERLLPPLAERWAPWWQLERALALACMELLDPTCAAEHMLRVVDERPFDLNARLDCAQALSMDARPAEAVAQLEAIEAVQAGRSDVRRLLAMELARLGDPRAAALLEELLAADPDDDDLRAFQGPGPYPPPEVRYQIGGNHDQHDEHDHDEH